MFLVDRFIQQKLGGPSVSDYEKLQTELSDLQTKYNDLLAAHQETCKEVPFDFEICLHFGSHVSKAVVSVLAKFHSQILCIPFRHRMFIIWGKLEKIWGRFNKSFNFSTFHSIYSFVLCPVYEMSHIVFIMFMLMMNISTGSYQKLMKDLFLSKGPCVFIFYLETLWNLTTLLPFHI